MPHRFTMFKKLAVFLLCAVVVNAGLFDSTPKCPSADYAVTDLYFPNPKDCSSFYFCNQTGVPQELVKCYAGLHFNPMKSRCESPDTAGCNIF
eukprot:TRINITY_DN3876_c0_g1_i2.p2 TRINITY_DN3876_c0_g1~~TRINITY_DN3876_c0_g1_i2.p2  ORF type:complete len:93 (+),score=20.71 TRINITY_DN3876_c0_g1_i2:103-381(+)